MYAYREGGRGEVRRVSLAVLPAAAPPPISLTLSLSLSIHLYIHIDR